MLQYYIVLSNLDRDQIFPSMLQILMKDVNQKIIIILVKGDTCEFNSFVQGYHAYMDIWNCIIGKTDLEVKHEGNEHNQFAIVIFNNKRAVDHVSKNLSKIFYQFLSLTGSTAEVGILGKRVNRVVNTCRRSLSVSDVLVLKRQLNGFKPK